MIKILKRWQRLILASSVIGMGTIIFGWQMQSATAQRVQDGWGMWGPGPHWREPWSGPNMSPWHRQRMERHWRFMHGEIPAEYRHAQNPLDYSDEIIEQGGKLYVEHCLQCHGRRGLGDGEAGKDLYPSPSLLAFVVQRPIAIDEYLLWTISEGGKAFKTEMPAFKNVLSTDEIWKVIAYMRSGFPVVESDEK